MKKNRWVLRLVSLLAISCVLSTTVSLAAEAGSTGDPLVTLSYLNETFLGNILSAVDQKIAARNSQIVQQLGKAQQFGLLIGTFCHGYPLLFWSYHQHTGRTVLYTGLYSHLAHTSGQ